MGLELVVLRWALPSGPLGAGRHSAQVVTVFEAHTLERGSLHFYNGILEWQTVPKLEAREAAGCSDAPAGLCAIHSRTPWDWQKVCLSCTPGSAASSENLYYENGVFRDHLSSPKQVHIDQSNPKRALACSASDLLHPLQTTCSNASVSLTSFLLKFLLVPVLQAGNSVSSLEEPFVYLKIITFSLSHCWNKQPRLFHLPTHVMLLDLWLLSLLSSNSCPL